MTLKTFSNEQDFIQASVTFIKKVVSNNESTTSIALSGGSTPKPVYEALAKENLPWRKIEFFQTDERYVPKTYADSNYKMVYESLIKPTQSIFRHFDTSLSIEAALEKYAKALPDKFDLVILGIGPDGHTASLFPHSKALQEKRLVAHTQTEAFTIKDRLTLTFPAILASKKLLVLLKGEAKKKVLRELGNQESETRRSEGLVPACIPERPLAGAEIRESDFPAKKLLEHEKLTIYFCNQENRVKF